MSDTDTLQGLTCPRCGGTVNIPEGVAIVTCPYCDQRSVVIGERGVRRYQVPCHIDREQALQAYRKFMGSTVSVARGALQQAQVSEVLLVHLPFWAGWGRALGWGFGQVQEGSGEHRRYRPRERSYMEDMTWTAAACDVGEFGVQRVELSGRPLEVFNADQLHQSGMVFEPVGSDEQAHSAAQADFERRVRAKLQMERQSQLFVRVIRPRLGIVYYPLWVVRYLYRGRAFQVVVDGFNGEVIYGKAPGSVLARSLALVGGMFLGSLIAVDGSALILSNADGDEVLIGLMLALGLGFGLMYLSWRKYRYGEHYEYQRYRGSGMVVGGVDLGGLLQDAQNGTGSGTVNTVIDILRRLR